MNMYSASALRKEREIYVIDDNREMRASLHRLLNSMGVQASCFGNAEDFIGQVEDLHPAPILLDIRMPDIDGLELMDRLRGHHDWPVIVMTGHGAIPLAVQAMKLGAIEFLEKPFKVEALEDALRQAFEALPRAVEMDQRRDLARQHFAELTPRERHIVLQLARGATNKTIARRFDLSVRTVEMHRARAMKKLRAGNLVEIAEIVAMITEASGIDDGD